MILAACQHFIVSGDAGIACGVTSQPKAPSHDDIQTVLGHASRNSEPGDPFFRNFPVKRRSEERARFALSDDVLSLGWIEKDKFPSSWSTPPVDALGFDLARCGSLESRKRALVKRASISGRTLRWTSADISSIRPICTSKARKADE
jgi:hypothetical protein